MKQKTTLSKLAYMLLVLLFSISTASATTYYSGGNTAASATANWWVNTNGTGAHPSNFTSGADVFIIQSGHAMTMAAHWSIAGSLTINSGGSLTSSGTYTISIAKTTTINGSLVLGGSGTKTFTGNISIGSTGVWNETSSQAVAIAGNLDNDGTFTAHTGTHTFTVASKTFDGNSPISIPNVVINATRTNNTTLTVSTALSGSSTLTNASGAILNIGGTATITGLTATAANNLVNYYANGSQTMKSTTYNNLTVSGSGPKSTAVTVNNTLSLEGTATISSAPTYGSSATLEYDGASARTVGSEFPASLTASGGLVVNSTGLITINASKSVSKLTVGAGGLLTTSNAAGQTFAVTTTTTLNGKFTVAGNGTKTFTGDMIVNNGGELEIVNSSETIFMNGNLTVNNGGTFSHNVNYASANYLQLNGNMDINGTYDYSGFTPAIWMNAGGGFNARTINTGNTALWFLLLRTGNFSASGNVTVDGPFYAAWNNPTGTFHTAGQNVVSNTVLVNAGGILDINGGTLTANAGGILTGNTVGGGTGTVTMSAGTLTATGISMGLTGSYNATFTQSGGTITTAGLTINAGSTYNCLSGTPALTVNGDLNNSGSFITTAGSPVINIAGTLNNMTGATFTNGASSSPYLMAWGSIVNAGTFTPAASANYNIKGNWTNNNSCVSIGGNITFSGTTNQTISGSASTTFNNLIINPDPGVTVNIVTNNISILNDLSVTAGTFDLGAFTANRTLAGGTLTVGVNATLKLSGSTGGRGASNFPNNFSTNTLNAASTIEYNGPAAQTVYGTTYGNLVLTNNSVKTLGAAASITGSVTVNSNATYDLSTFTSNRTAGSGTFNVNSNATLKLAASSGGQTGSNFPSGFTVFNLDPASTVEYNAGNTVNQTVYAPVTYGNLVLTNATGSGSSVKTLTANITGVAGNLTVNPYVTFDQATFNTTRVSVGGTLTLNANSVLILGKTGVAFPVNFSTVALDAASTVEYDGAATPQTIFTTTYGHLILNNPTPATTSVKSLAGNISVAGNLTLTGPATFDMGTNTANRTAAGGTLSMAATSIMNVSGTSGGQAGSNFPLNFSTMTLNATSTVNYNAASGTTQTVYGGATYGNLTLTNGTGSGTSGKILTANVTGIGGNLQVNSNTTFDLVTFTANRTSGTGTMTVGSNSIIKLGATSGGQTGSNFPSGFTTFSFAASSTTQYDAPNGTVQTIFAAPLYGNLILTNKTATANATKNLSANLTGIAGNLTVATYTTFDQLTYTSNRSVAGGTFSLAANGVHRISGTSGGACANNNYPANFSTVTLDPASTTEYYGSGQDICSTPLYGNLTLSSAGTKTASSGTTRIRGNFVNNSPSVFAHNDGTISMEGSGNQNFAGVGYFNLSFSNGGTKTLSAAGSVAKELNVGTSTTVALSNSNLTMRSTATRTANIAVIPSGASFTYGTGRFVVERYINTGTGIGQHAKSWQLVSTPAYGQSIYSTWQEGGATPAGYGTWITGPGVGVDAYSAGPSLKYYDPATDYYIGVANTSSNIERPAGYFLYVRGDRATTATTGPAVPTTLRTTGKIYQPNDPPAAVAVPKGKYQSVGNPYASAIDLDYLKTNGAFWNINRDVIVWDPTTGGSYGFGVWQTLSAANNYEPTIGSSVPTSMYPAGVSSPYIQSGQAFFVHSANGATVNGSFSFGENAKVSSSRLVTRGQGNDDRYFFRAGLYSSGNIADGNAVAFGEEFGNAIDADDALKIPNSGENFSLMRTGQNLSVEARAVLNTGSDTIFYNITNLRQQAYQLKFAPKNMPAAITAFLVDRFLASSTALSITDSSTVDFTVTSAPASYAANRFYVVFKPLTVLPVTITSIEAERRTDKTIEVKWKVENEINIATYTVERSSDGRFFAGISTIAATNLFAYLQVDTKPLITDNYYRIKIVSGNGKITYSSIVKVASKISTGSISVYPNPVEDKTAQLVFTGQEQGTYSIQFSNVAGQVIASTKVKVTASNVVVPVQLPANTAAGIYQMKVAKENGKGVTSQVVVN
ncbi:hypothetical protein [Ferruginibacter sp. HRS2-29]|uniref:hypothetical protein n=1 Tax=Ferruginibacter sp. HRS2-29 TaxID=2487334 RepID=UPI0020CCEED5|nr:hypothetical protein [Ferruginibacter sp. HRS2-29]MCP9751987.1 hypothetical protein [Ferruginibacter sp. HRS2-29]